jgi:tRNA1(Val) A37 N6-methylase TrmN6
VVKTTKRAKTEDRLLGGRVRILQPAVGYRVAIDPVLLAAAVPARTGETVLDIGTGSGAAALCLAARVDGCRVLGLEKNAAMARLARASARLNMFDEAVTIMEGDLAHPPPGLVPGRFDRVMANPPYLEEAAAARRGSRARASAHVEGAARLGAWVDFALQMTRMGGTITIIHRADRLDDLLARFHGKAGGIIVFPFWPKRGRPAKRVIVHAVKGSRAPLVLASGLVLHAATGAYTKAADAILRDSAALSLEVGRARVGNRRRPD